jgi:hypothetical protein
MSNTKYDKTDYGLDVMERFIYSIEEKVEEIQNDLFYLKQWLKLTQEGDPTVMKIKSRQDTRR